MERRFKVRAAKACSEANRLQRCRKRLRGREPSAAPPLHPPAVAPASWVDPQGPLVTALSVLCPSPPPWLGVPGPRALASPEDGPAAILGWNVTRAEREDVHGRSPVALTLALTLVLFSAVSPCR